MGGINGTSGSVSQGRAGSMTESPLDQQSASEAGPHRQAQASRPSHTLCRQYHSAHYADRNDGPIRRLREVLLQKRCHVANVGGSS